MCSRMWISKMLQKIVQEVLEGNQVDTSLLDYINNNHVTNIVLGSSSRSPITRKFWTHDVPTLINKAAPDYCSVYVIAKGKPQSIRPAVSSTPPNNLPSLQASVEFNHSEPAHGNRASHVKGDRKTDDDDHHHHHEAFDRWFRSYSNDNPTVPNRATTNPAFHSFLDSGLMEPGLSFSSMDITRVQISDTNNSEAMRLKQELKQTMNMYTTACKQAISAQHRR
ncbi:hypothetical protein OROHE_013858 [Orobanche hederae]